MSKKKKPSQRSKRPSERPKRQRFGRPTDDSEGGGKRNRVRRTHPDKSGVAADDTRNLFLTRHQDWIRQSFALEAATAPPDCVVVVGTLDQDAIWHLFASYKGKDAANQCEQRARETKQIALTMLVINRTVFGMFWDKWLCEAGGPSPQPFLARIPAGLTPIVVVADGGRSPHRD